MKVRIDKMPERLSAGDFQLRSLFGSAWVNQTRAFVGQGSWVSDDLTPPDAQDLLRKFQAAGAMGDLVP